MRTMGLGTKLMLAAMTAVAVAACADNEAAPTKATTGVTLNELEVATRAELPACDADHESRLAFVADEQKLVVCVGGTWKDVAFPKGDKGEPGGGAGSSSLVKLTTLPGGDPTCPGGGFQIDVGIDKNANGVLDGDEIDETATVCQAGGARKRTVFVTSEKYTGNLGGVEGADAICQARANGVPSLAGKTFKAWIEKNEVFITERFTIDGEFRLVDGTLVANRFLDFANAVAPGSDFLGIPFAHPISLDENGAAGPAEVWTGIFNGVGYMYTCDDWTNGTDQSAGVYGMSNEANQNWSLKLYDTCDTPRALYCFEQ